VYVLLFILAVSFCSNRPFDKTRNFIDHLRVRYVPLSNLSHSLKTPEVLLNINYVFCFSLLSCMFLLQAPKYNADDLATLSSTCFKLNSLQLRALLSKYQPTPDEPRLPHELIENVVRVRSYWFRWWFSNAVCMVLS
jgi:hypothetical protein